MLPATVEYGKKTYYLYIAPYENLGWGVAYFNIDGMESVTGLNKPTDLIDACILEIEWLVENGFKLNTDKDGMES